MPALRIAQGTRSPSLTETLTVDGEPFDLSAAAGVRFRMRSVRSSELKVDAAAVIVTPPGVDGKIRYDWGVTDTDTADDYACWWRVDLGGGKVQEHASEFTLEVFAHGAPRPTMAALLARLRSSIGDQAGPEEVFTDAELQDFLDRRRIDVPRLELRAVAEPAPGASQYLAFHDPYFGGHWEADATLHGAQLAELTPTSADHLMGAWYFAASQLPPVYVVGKTYDVNAAAADALQAWASREALSFDVTADDARLLRSQKHAMLLEQAAAYRRSARPPLPAGRLARVSR